MYQTIKEELTLALKEALAGLIPKGEVSPDIQIDIPEEEAFGEFSSNLAMQLGRLIRRPPEDIAQAIVTSLKNKSGIIHRLANPTKTVAPILVVAFFTCQSLNTS